MMGTGIMKGGQAKNEKRMQKKAGKGKRRITGTEMLG
jgi:hypothetical protein